MSFPIYQMTNEEKLMSSAIMNEIIIGESESAPRKDLEKICLLAAFTSSPFNKHHVDKILRERLTRKAQEIGATHILGYVIQEARCSQGYSSNGFIACGFAYRAK